MTLNEPEISARRRVYLVRHGDVSYFDAQGRPFPPNAVPLNDEGLRQARALGEFFRDVPLDRAVSSDLPRSIQTAEAALGGRTTPAVEALPALREIQPGRLGDIAVADLKRVFVDAFTANMDRSMTRDCDRRERWASSSVMSRLTVRFRAICRARSRRRRQRRVAGRRRRWRRCPPCARSSRAVSPTLPWPT